MNNKNWVIIDSSTPDIAIEMVPRDISWEFNRRGIEPLVIQLFKGRGMTPDVLERELRKANPEGIILNSARGWEFAEVFQKINCPKYSMWFDDPLFSIESFRVEDQIRSVAKDHDVKFFVWDRYWADKMNMKFGIYNMNTIELACNDVEFYETSEPLTDDVVFIGCLHSLKAIAHISDGLSKCFKVCFEEYKDWMKANTFHVKHHSAFLDLFEFTCNQEFREFKRHRSGDYQMMKWCMWAYGKNFVRIEMLKEAIKITPIVIFSETRQLNHANEFEIRSMLDCWNDRIRFIDTSRVHSKDLGYYYHFGKLHLQATEPQSVYGGIPLRTYQTAASGVPLLTDVRFDWDKSFEYGKEIVVYEGMAQFGEKLLDLMKDESMRKEVGKNARKRFLEQHTWDKRLDQMIKPNEKHEAAMVEFMRNIDVNSLNFNPIINENPTIQPVN